MYQLRDYQQQSVELIRNAFRNKKNKPLLVLPTGSGKTVVFSYIAYHAAKKGLKVMVIVHRQELVKQTSEKLSSWDIPHGIISPEFNHTNDGVQIAMIQTLTRRLLKTERPDLLIFDECHHSFAANYKKIIDWTDNKTIGVTATPCRLDGRGLGEIYDEMVIGPTTKQLIDSGFLSKYKYFATPVPREDKENLKKKLGDYTIESMKKIVDGQIPNIVEEWKSKAIGLPTLVFCPSVETTKTVSEMFKNSGYIFEPLTGLMDKKDRKEIIKALSNREIHGITSCDIISEGFDIPICSCAILLRKTASTSLFLQQVGRVLRPEENKIAIIIDMVQNYEEHGLPCDEREWSLTNKVKKTKENFCLCPQCEAVNPKTKKYCKICNAILNYKECPECMGIVPSFEKKCNCGYEFKREEKKFKQSNNFTLAQVTAVDGKLKKQIMMPLRKFLESKGWNPNAAYYKWKLLEYLGCSPFKADKKLWENAYSNDSKKYTFDSFVKFNKKLFKEFDGWNKLAKQ